MSNFSSIPIVFRRFFTWIALGDADLRFSLILVRKANAVDDETKRGYITNGESMQVTVGVTVTSLSASLLHKISAATDRLCQIPLNRKSLHKFEKLCKFSSHVKAKSRKMESHKMRHACILYVLCGSHNKHYFPYNIK
jgi:hypothetical protein